MDHPFYIRRQEYWSGCFSYCVARNHDKQRVSRWYLTRRLAIKRMEAMIAVWERFQNRHDPLQAKWPTDNLGPLFNTDRREP